MEHILQTVSGVEVFYSLDDFTGYNQVLIVEPNRLKTTFHTKWGMFTYQRISFVLVNEGATFQSAMDITFHGLIRQSVVVYLDDMTIFSRQQSNHPRHINKIFE